MTVTIFGNWISVMDAAEFIKEIQHLAATADASWHLTSRPEQPGSEARFKVVCHSHGLLPSAALGRA